MESLNSFIPALESIGVLGYWIVFLICLAEALPFVGLLIPGTVLVVFFGFLSAQGYLDMGDLIWFATAGAILGDLIGYYLGTQGMRFFHNENKILKLSHLDKGEKFFKKHGSKSIFFGRFIGPVRPIVPFIAGLSGMDKKFFLLWNVISGFLWSATFLLLGFFFSAVSSSIELWSRRTGIILLSVVVVGVFVRNMTRQKKSFE